MKWRLELNGEGVYWYAADLPCGREVVVEYPDPLVFSDWEARLYPPEECGGMSLASGPDPEACMARAETVLRGFAVLEARAWARALK